MRILIVQPATNPHVWGGDSIFILEPLWAEYLGAGLKVVHDVQLLDLRLYKNPDQVLEETQNRFQPDLIAMTAYTVDVNTVKRYARECKTRNPRLRTVVGGYHTNICADGFGSGEVDLLIFGEGVFTLAEVARAWERGLPAENIPGVGVPTPKGVLRSALRPWPHLDEFPFPDRSLTANVRKNYFDKWMKPIASIRGSYGCPYRCEFCVLWPPMDGRYLSRSPESFVNELATIEEPNVFFTDDEALIQPKRMAEIASLIETRGIQKNYYFMTRSDSILSHQEVFERWAAIGLKRVLIGLETHRPEDLNDYNKKTTIADNDAAIEICAKNGVEIQAMFVLNPDYEREDFAVLREYVAARNLNAPVYCILTPYPGTTSYAAYKDRITVDNYDYWDLMHAVVPTRLPLDEFYTEYAQLWGAVPLMQRGILAHRTQLPAEETLKNVSKMRQGFRKSTP